MKKHLLFAYIFLSVTFIFAQKTVYNLKKGFVANGYDVVSYFEQAPQKGTANFTYQHHDIKLKFVSKQHLEQFKSNPDKYLPQYGGWCAYAMGVKGKMVSIDAETYEIRNNKLYLFYNAWGTNTLQLWLQENPEQLRLQADKYWTKKLQL